VRKIDAIVNAAFHVAQSGFENISKEVQQDPIGTLRAIPYIGPVTAYHLAKNLGMCTAKPDRHLNRYAVAMGFLDAHDLCRIIAENTNEPINVVDLILWRYIEQNPQH